MTRVNVQASVIQMKSLSARENARLAVLIGLGDLQKYLGPDQRASARAEILSGSNNPYWTGVWDSRDNSRLAWLVSGETPDHQIDYTATPDYEELVPKSPVTQQGVVSVPSVAIENNNQSSGRFAYWVEDESVKAKVNLANSFQESSDAEELRAAVTVAPRYGLTAVSDLEGLELDLADLDKVFSAEQYRSLQQSSISADSDVWQERSHDLTVHSYGVLSDTKNGGLKRDLTAAFNVSTEFSELVNFHESGDRIFAPASVASPTVQDPGGPLWEQMRSYYNLKASSSGSVAVRPQTNTDAGVYPVVTAAQQYFSVSKDGNLINLHYMPAVTLWNPYNVALESSDYTLVFGRSAGGVSLKESYTSFIVAEIILWQAGQPRVDLYRGPYVYQIRDVRLEPGETRVFSPPSGHQSVSFSSNALTDSGILYNELNFIPPTLEPGLRILDSSFYETVTEPEPWISFRALVQPTRIASFGLFQGSSPQIHDNVPLQQANFLLMNDRSNPRGFERIGPVIFPPFDTPIIFDSNELFGFRYRMNFVSNTTHISDRRYANIPWLKHYNPRAASLGISPFEFLDETSARINPTYDATLDLLEFRHLIETDFDNGFTGYSLSGSGSLDTRLFEITRNTDQLISLGQFTHAPLFNTGIASSNNARQAHIQSMSRGRFDNLIPAFPFGNSAADPRIPLDQIAFDWGTDVTGVTSYGFNEFDGTHYDYSWLLNDVLWDAYFLSTIPLSGDVELPLPNPRLRLDQSAAFYNNADNDTELIALRSFNEASAHLMVDGPFNVNSTSTEAWSALIASFSGVPVPVNSPTSSYNTEIEEAPITRLTNNINSPLSSDTNSYLDEAAYNGFRILTVEEVRSLAVTIVAEVKLRGPFMSLSDFVNRSLTVDEFGIKGALQAAIDKSGINETFESDDIDLDPHNLIFNQTRLDDSLSLLEETPGSSGINATIAQADIMTKVGPVLTPRGDTFVILAMGTSSNPVSGNSESRAFCEAVVQRFPSFVDPLDDASTTPSSTLSTLNQQFGRQFKIVSFRWVTENEK